MSEANEIPISSHIYIGRLDDIQTAPKPFKKSDKIESNFYCRFGTSLIIQNNEPGRPDRDSVCRLNFSKLEEIKV